MSVGKIKPTQRIFDVVKDIHDDNYRLPSIQRSFVWDRGRICKLLDSLMSDYPIGSFLVWKPPQQLKIRTRRFAQRYESGVRPLSEESSQGPAYLVLDERQKRDELYFYSLVTNSLVICLHMET